MQISKDQPMNTDDMIPIIGIDIGGTLSKVSFACKKGIEVTITTIDHLSSKSLISSKQIL